MGFEPYLDSHPDHWGGDNLEGRVNGTWYHLVIENGGPPRVHPLSHPEPYWIDALHQDHYYRPSGMHRVDWVIQQALPFLLP